MRISYHNHTTWSDGSSTVDEFIAAARAAGLDELGISDHYILTPDGAPVEWGMNPDALDDYLAELREARARTKDLTIRLGIETDFFPETAELLRRKLLTLQVDYVIGSVHFLDGFPIDYDASHWAELSEDQRNEKMVGYFRRVRQLAESGMFDIVGHLDLPKKFGFFPTVDIAGEVQTTLNAIAALGMSIELNTAGWDKAVQEAYPSPEILRMARRLEIPLVITADAHRADNVVNHFDRARALAQEAGYSELSGYAGRRRFTFPLEQ